MKKFKAQIYIGIICVLLGFMVTYQFKMISKQNLATDTNKNTPEIIIENEQLKNQIEEMKKKVNELDSKTSEYENAAVGLDQQSEILYKELEQTRILTGGTEVAGKGIIIYIDPKTDAFDSGLGGQTILDEDLVRIRNELNAAEAEAISINDIRLTSRSGIRNAGNAIMINDERVSYNERVIIKAIGNKKLLESAIRFQGTISQNLLLTCKITIEPSDEITLPKYSKTYKFEYAKPIEKNRGE